MPAPLAIAPLAITIDLDDTLWPIAPVIERAEASLEAWLHRHAPRAAQRWPAQAMRALRDRIGRERPDLAHDFSTQRRLSLAHILADSGEDAAHLEPAYAAFLAARNAVQCYPDSIAALERLAARLPLAALTNGNADLDTIGLRQHFRFVLGAREHGKPKPAACIFHAACARLQLEPRQVMHVGDDSELDVIGAAKAGMTTCWVNRDGRRWPHAEVRPNLEVATLTELADWMDRQRPYPHPNSRTAPPARARGPGAQPHARQWRASCASSPRRERDS